MATRREGGSNANVLAGETQRFIHSSFSSFSPHSERGELPRRLSSRRRSLTEPETNKHCAVRIAPEEHRGGGKRLFGFLRSFSFLPPSSSQGYRVSTPCLRCLKRVKSADCHNVSGVLSTSSQRVRSEETAWFFFLSFFLSTGLSLTRTPCRVSGIVPHLFLAKKRKKIKEKKRGGKKTITEPS